MTSDTPQSKGGKVRAQRLSPEERRRIASEGGKAKADATSSLPYAQYPGEVSLGAASIPCAVLSNGRRVLSEAGIVNAILGVRSGASKRLTLASAKEGDRLPMFIAPPRLKPFITEEMLEGPLQRILYRHGGRTLVGYDPSILQAVCEVWLRAREAGALQEQQKDKAQRAEQLMRALANIGLIALVDEATGYQQVRQKDELQQILAHYIAPELLPWTKRFPDSFYEQLHRVKGWRYDPSTTGRHPIIGHLTNTFIYQKLPPGVLEELQAKNPVDPNTRRRKQRHHQLLTQQVGQPHLEKQIVTVTMLLRISDNWNEFRRHFDRAFPPGPGDLFALPRPGDAGEAQG